MQDMMRSVFERISGALAIVVSAFAVTVIVSGCICFVFKIQPAVVMSDSMRPVINAGDLCFVDRKDRDVGVGRIIAFRKGGVHDLTVMHRIIDIRKDGSGSFVTKGDSNKDPDMGYVSPDDVIGSYMFSVPGLGYFVYFVSTPSGIFLCFFILAGYIVLLTYLRSRGKSEG